MKFLFGIIAVLSNLAFAAPSVELKISFLCDGEITSQTKSVLSQEDLEGGGLFTPFQLGGKCDPKLAGAKLPYGWSNTLRVVPEANGQFSAALQMFGWETPIGGKPSSFLVMQKDMGYFPVVGQSASVFEHTYLGSGRVRIETRVEVVRITE